MTRLRDYLNAAGQRVVGGAALDDALRDAAGDVSPAMTAQELRERASNLSSTQRTFFVAIRSTVTVPEAFQHSTAGYRILGERNGRRLNVGPYTYLAEVSGLVTVGAQQWRLAKVRAHPYFARSWQLYADETGGVQFYGSYAETQAAVEAALTASQALNLLRSINDAWILPGGGLSRNGFSPTPDTSVNPPAPVAAPVVAGSVWHPMEVLAGEDPDTVRDTAMGDLTNE